MVDATRGWDIMLDARIHAGVHALGHWALLSFG